MLRLVLFFAIGVAMPLSTLQAGLPSRFHDFPQIGDGAGITTTFLIFNQNDTQATVTISFFGDNGAPLSLTVNGETATSIQAVVPARGTVSLSSDGSGDGSGGAKVGWARLVANQEVGAQAFFEIRQGDAIVTQATVESTGSQRLLDVFVGQEAGTRSGVALVNLSESPIAVRLTLRDSQGSVRGTIDITLQGREHTAMFIDELFPDVNLTRGSMNLSSTGPLGVTTLQQTGLVIGTLPIIETF